MVLEWTDPPFAPGHWIPEMVALAGGVDAHVGEQPVVVANHELPFLRTLLCTSGGFIRAVVGPPLACAAVDLDEFQRLIDATFGERDRARGVPSSVAWLAEEVGELAQAVRKGSHDQQIHEFADVLAWLTSLANQVGVNLSEAAQRYANGCPRCTSIPCTCE